jgi:endonuclease/exonuclease/phosphatase family metal-dependent hydrolase
VDRTAGEVLWAGGLHDAAAVLRAPWQPTVGHHRDDSYGTRGVRRRIDGVRATADVVPALRAHRVTDTELARRASDHLPVTVEYDPSAITAP